MYCKMRTLSWILYVLNILCALMAILLLLYGSWLLTSIEDLPIDHGEQLAAITIIALACVLLLTIIYGSVAACKQSRCLLISYTVIMIIMLAFQVLLTIISYAALFKGPSAALEQGFNQLFEADYHINGNLQIYEKWLQCCGKNSAEDYILALKLPPSSCCKDQDCTIAANLFMSGCEAKFQEYIADTTLNFNIISWIIIALEFTITLVTCLLMESIRVYTVQYRMYCS